MSKLNKDNVDLDFFDEDISKAKKKKNKRIEDIIHEQICNYIFDTYPDWEVNTDLAGLRLTFGQANKVKKLRTGNGFPDITIYKTVKDIKGNIIKAGLFIEVKKASPYKKSGELYKSERLETQNAKHIKLREQGYVAEFVWTLEQAKELINNYLKI